MKKHTKPPCHTDLNHECNKWEREVSYKPSGIQWLGQIPKHWEVRRIKHIASNIIGGGTPETSNPKYWTTDKENSYLWVSIEDLTKSSFIQDTKKYITSEGVKFSSAQIIQPFSILYSIYASLGKIGYSDKILTTNQAILSITTKKECFYKFLFYYLHITTQNINTLSSMTTQNNINLFILQNIKIPFPPLKEQKAIANYLDTKCEKIAEFISKKEHTITLLKELKDSIINKAVTQGLDENTAFKDSGIQWLGQIPKHWEVRRIKYLAYVKGRIGFHGLKSDEFQYDNGAYLVTGNDFFNNIVEWEKCRRITEERYYEDPNIHLKNNDLLITKDGSIGKVAIVKDCPKQATLNSGIFLVRVNEMLCFVRYLFYIIHSQYFKEFIAFKTCGSTILHLYQSDFNAFKIPLPPLKEQKAIANYLDDKITKIERAISNIKEQIEQMRAYKTSLINECVCGRIDLNKEQI